MRQGTEWEWDPSKMEEAVEYDVESILEAAWEGAMQVYKVQWSNRTEGWEPLTALAIVSDMVQDFEAGQEKKKAGSAGSV